METSEHTEQSKIESFFEKIEKLTVLQRMLIADRRICLVFDLAQSRPDHRISDQARKN
jgi:hypothetical protein